MLLYPIFVYYSLTHSKGTTMGFLADSELTNAAMFGLRFTDAEITASPDSTLPFDFSSKLRVQLSEYCKKQLKVEALQEDQIQDIIRRMLVALVELHVLVGRGEDMLKSVLSQFDEEMQGSLNVIIAWSMINDMEVSKQ